MKVSGWGRFPSIDGQISHPRDDRAVAAQILNGRTLIPRGAGRSYGDSALNHTAIVSSDALNRILAFDAQTGDMIAEAGVLLADIVALWLPRGWFPPVTPGTKFVTLGGMVASDVHGKNHHSAGSFAQHVAWIDLMTADGEVVRCSPSIEPALFWATCGGMGLTGFILRVAFRLLRVETPYIRQRTLRAENLEHAIRLFEENASWTYSVAWIDCMAKKDKLGRSLIYLGEHATADEASYASRPAKKPKRIPIDFPSWSLNRLSVTAFNELYYRKGKPGDAYVHVEPYFYPLDGVLEWNRIYGANGFLQHQCVVPKTGGAEALTKMLTEISNRGIGSFLAVLKLLGPAAGPLSFPMEGYTLALDFPASSSSFNLLRELDAIVEDYGGRVYLTKDARAGSSMLNGYPQLQDFRETRDRVDPEHRFRSLQSERLGL